MKKNIWIMAVVMGLAAFGFAGIMGCQEDWGTDSDNMTSTGIRVIVEAIEPNNVQIDAFPTVCEMEGSTPVYDTGWITDESFDVEFHLDGTVPDGASQTGFIITSYDVTCVSNEPGGEYNFVFHSNIGLGGWMGPDDELLWDNVPYMTRLDKSNFALIGNPLLQPFYSCYVVFHGENTYGYEVETDPVGFPIIVGEYIGCN